MKIAVLGTGDVGTTIATALLTLGHQVRLGSRTVDNAAARAWVDGAGAGASVGVFADATAFGDLVFLCVKGEAAPDVLDAAGSALTGKVVVDVSNPLDFSKGMPPTLLVTNTDSLGEQLQRRFPAAKIVKTLNTVSCKLMVNAAALNGGDHTMFICGDDNDAKARVLNEVLKPFGWRDVVDLGGISQARATEGYLPLWVRLYGALSTGGFNVKVVR